MQYSETKESLDDEDRKFFYKKFKSRYQANIIITLLCWFILYSFINSMRRYIIETEQYYFIHFQLFIYIIICVASIIHFIITYSNYKKTTKLVYKILVKGFLDKKLMKLGNYILTLDRGRKKIEVPGNSFFFKKKKDDIVVVHCFEDSEKVFRYEKINP